MAFQRPILSTLLARSAEPRRFLQVLAGPRQTGKTTLARQLLDEVTLPNHYASADDPALRDRSWLTAQWEIGRLRAAQAGSAGAVLVLDEVQKITGWSDVVKQLWDEDTASGSPLKVVLLGSAPLLVQRGLAESLTGRFELIPVTHWSLSEMQNAFGWSVQQYVYFGGYPGAAPLIDDELRWTRYALDALIEPTIARDVLLLTRVDKPALLRQLFHLATVHSGQVLSYQKMVGQLQDAGNTTTLAHYLDLLSAAGMVTGLQKYAGAAVRQRGSSPKLLALNTGLISAQSPHSLAEAQADRAHWGRLVESAVGAHLANSIHGTAIELLYWRERNLEVDFVLRHGERRAAIEVKSGRPREARSGLAAFQERFGPARTWLVGSGGLALSEFLSSPAPHWL